MHRIFCAAFALTIAFPPSSLAGKPKKAKKHDEVKVTITIGAEEREAVRQYFVTAHGRGKCPPGLAKKNNGCLPPGLAKKRYVVGSPLASTVVVEEPPQQLLVHLGPPPMGYRYVIVDGDLVKLAVGTAMVVDAIEGLVN